VTFGTQTFADETFGAAEVSITAISPARASRDGGTKVTLSGSFPTDQTYTVTVDGVTAYSGVSGQGTTIQSTGDEISFALPPVAAADIGSLTVEVTASPSSDTAQTSIEVTERAFGSASFELRRMFPRWYGVGARRLELEPLEQ
jgi:hypothetical protein